MSVITSIKQQKNKGRVNIYLDNKFGFGIDLDNFVLLKLKIGQDLSDEELKDLINKSEFQKTLNKLLNFAYIRPRSEKEIKDWLKRKKISDVMHSDLFSKLKYFNLLDDEKFAKWWVEMRQELSPRSKRILSNELKIKGIKNEILNKVLDSTVIDEKGLALGLLKKRTSHWKAVPKEKQKQKMLEYLVRKGFGFEIAKFAVKGYNNK